MAMIWEIRDLEWVGSGDMRMGERDKYWELEIERDKAWVFEIEREKEISWGEGESCTSGIGHGGRCASRMRAMGGKRLAPGSWR